MEHLPSIWTFQTSKKKRPGFTSNNLILQVYEDKEIYSFGLIYSNLRN